MANFLEQLNKPTKIILGIGFSLIIYGYLCRLVGIYFFWESLSIGYVVTVLGIIIPLRQSIQQKRGTKKSATGEKVVIGVIIFSFFILTVLSAFIAKTDAYSAAQAYLIKDEKLISKIGAVKAFSIIPIGGFSIQKDYSYASINLTVKGENKFIDLTVYVVKTKENPVWEVKRIE